MYAFIIQQASSVGAAERQSLAVDAIREASPSNGRARHALGLALVSIGQRIAGEMPAGRAQADPDCA
jgi:hypothetical protein